MGSVSWLLRLARRRDACLFMRTVAMAQLSAVLALGCGGAPAPPDDREQDKLGDREHDDVPTRVAAAVKYLKGDKTCFQGQDTSHCDWEDVVLDWKAFEPQKSNDAILIIDSFQEHLMLMGLIRFQNRVKGLYRISSNASNQYDLQVPVEHVPRRLGEVLANLAGPGFVASTQLLDVANAVDAVYGRHLAGFLGHGGAVFGQLVDLVPENPIVLVDLVNGGYPPDVWCHTLDAAALQKARARSSALADSLRKIITDNNVHYINVSSGATADNLTDKWRQSCGDGAVPSTEELRALFDTIKPFYDVLFNTEGVVAAHAAIAIGDPVDFPFDQASSDYPNQVRTGFFSSHASGLDGEGRGNLVKVNQYPPNASDADVFLNWGCDQGPLGPRPGQCATPHFEIAGAFGLGAGTMFAMETSWIAPLAVARLVNLKNSRHANESWSNELVARMKQELTPRACGPDGSSICQYQDPFARAAEQLEVYRLGYMR